MRRILLALLVSLAAAGSASAQLSGENIKGDNGLKSGSQPPPGTYLTNLSYFYNSDEIKLPGGNSIVSTGDGLNVFANLTVISRVTKKKFLGANYGVQLAVPLLNTQLELPRLNKGSSTGGVADLYVMPLWLGWNKKRAEYVASYAFSAPTGRFTPGGDNSGLGMWSHEISGGTTVYFDKLKSWHASALAAYEIHQKKQGTDVRVGDLGYESPEERLRFAWNDFCATFHGNYGDPGDEEHLSQRDNLRALRGLDLELRTLIPGDSAAGQPSRGEPATGRDARRRGRTWGRFISDHTVSSASSFGGWTPLAWPRSSSSK